MDLKESRVLLTEPADGVPDVVADQVGLAEAVAALAAGRGPIALDAERASGFRYGQRAFLIQLRRADVGTQLVDPEPLSDFTELADDLAGSEWILHAATQDLPCLADLGLQPDAIFDTELAARLLGYPKVGLASLTETLLGIELAKTHSAADWSRRPLPSSWLKYAALDVELLHQLRAILTEELIQSGRKTWADQEFESLLGFQPRQHAEPWRRVSGLHKIKEPERLAVVRSLWQEREETAERVDRAPGRILPDKAIIAAAQARPGTLKELSEIPEFSRHRRRLKQWWSAISSAYDLPADERPAKAVAEGPPPKRTWERRNPEAAERLTVVREFVVGRAEDLGITPEILISPDLIRRVAWEPPTDITAEVIASRLDEGGARPWQIEQVAGGVAAALD